MVAEAADYDVRMSGDLTSGGLIGGVRDGEVVPGIANKYDVICFDEASSLFRIARGDHSANFAEHLNNILDGRNVTKDLATGNLDYEPRCVLTGITYPPDDIDYQRFMTNGTLSRFFIFYRPIDSEFFKSTSREVLQRARASEPDVDQSITDIQRLGTIIRAIALHYDVGFQFDHQFGKEVEDMIIDAIHGTSEEYTKEIQELVEPDLTRMVENTLKLGAVFAALDYCSEVVDDSHMESAVRLIERSWRQTLDFFEAHYQANDTRNGSSLNEAMVEMLKTLLRNDPKTQSEVADDIDRSNRTVREYASELESLGLIETVTKEREKEYKIKID
ncbi:HVO_A0114 family putative DNA-binding protein [Halorubrum sp. FL23]|uniref:HVO_A0114 family putative DNA-binding protein n=1 Tax=Halorubrum sp. FL23 TaxID=3458704 RepID=UPI0040344EA0